MAGNSTVQRTKQAKIRAAAAVIAIQMAKKAGDPMYRRFKKSRNAFIRFKKRIEKRYIRTALAIAQQKISSKQSSPVNKAIKQKTQYDFMKSIMNAK